MATKLKMTARRDFLKKALLGSAIWWPAPPLIRRALIAAQYETLTPAISHRMGDRGLMTAPRCSRIPGTHFRIGGRVHDYLAGVSEQWLKVAPRSNPAMLEMFRD